MLCDDNSDLNLVFLLPCAFAMSKLASTDKLYVVKDVFMRP